MCLISLISCWHDTHTSRHSVRLMNERQSLHHPQSKVVCRNLFGLWLLKHWKTRIAYKQWRSNSEGVKYEIRKEKPKVTYLVMAFPAAENENRQLEDLPQADFCRVPERFLLFRPIVCFCSNSTHVFILSALTHFTIFIRGLSILLLSFIIKVDFSCQ